MIRVQAFNRRFTSLFQLGIFVRVEYLLLFVVCGFNSIFYLGCDRVKGEIEDHGKLQKSSPVANIVPVSGTTIRLLPGHSGSLSWSVQNIGMKTLKITNITSSCGCAKPRVDADEIQPGEKTHIWLDFSGNELGTRDHVVRVETNDATNPEISLPLRSEVQTPVEVFPASLTLAGNVGESVKAGVVVRPIDGEPLKILSLTCHDPGVSYEVVSSSDKHVRLQFASSIIEASRRTAVFQILLEHPLGEFTYNLPVVVVANEAPNVAPAKVLLNDCRPGSIHQLNFTVPANQKVTDVRVSNLSQNAENESPFSVPRYNVVETPASVNRVHVQVLIGTTLGYHSEMIEFHFESAAVEAVQVSGFIAANE